MFADEGIVMKLFIVRHGLAEDKLEFAKSGQEDSERPLVSKGVKQTEKVAKALKRKLGKIDVLVSSPYLRALQTAEVLKREWNVKDFVVSEALLPDTLPVETWRLVISKSQHKKIVLVGHEPHLQFFTAWLITNRAKPFLEYKKSGVACIEVSHFEPRHAELKWFIQPKLLLSSESHEVAGRDTSVDVRLLHSAE